ncbi:hypothetical protein S40288_00451 [Stachybotrys chartarum IBT 40288]|nr:hypothetical protein S40288_00451 [Stachybotrys chartarum IBT 40288]
MTANGSTSNGQAASRRPLPCGIYAPTMTFFDSETEDLDIPTIKKHAERLAKAGLAGLVIMGSNGEAVHCTREEKIAVVKASREALNEAGFESTPIIFGATEGSVRGTIELTRLAVDAGADYTLLLPPSYYRPQMDEEAVVNYFLAVADKSAAPIILYNYPGAVSGVDLDSDVIIKLAEHPNIVGTKFTCGNTGKLTRVARATNAKTPFQEGSGYMAFGGMCDFTVQTLVSGGSGIIAGGANVMPKVCARVWNLYSEGKRDEAEALQKILSRGDWPLTKAAIAGTKAAIQSYYGYGGYPRRPLKRLEKARISAIEEGTKEVMEVEMSLGRVNTYRKIAGEQKGASSPPMDPEQPSQPNPSEQTPLLQPQSDSPAARESPEENEGSDQEQERTVVAKQLPFRRLALIMATSWLGVFLGAIDSTIIATLSAPISSEFKSLSLMSWLATAYLISNAACQPVSGRLTDIFGRGPGLVFSNIFFAAGNLICGLAKDQSVMILGRVIAGIGGGGLMSISTFLGSDLIPLRQRGVVQGIGNLCYGSGAMLGGIFGGAVNDHTKWGWRLAFLVQVPPVLFSAVAVSILVRVPPKQSDKSYLARIDFGGVFLTVTFLVLLLLGLNAGGNLVPWTHPLVLTTIPLALVAFATFLWWESRVVQPIIPVRLLLTRTVLSACLCNLFCTMAVMAGLFYVPLYLQVIGDTATGAGLKILPSQLGISIASIGAGYAMKRTGKYVKLGIASLVSVIVGIVVFLVQTPGTAYALSGLGFFFVGAGYGAMLTTTLLACIAAVDHSQQAVITSATYLARSLGGTVGITIGSAVYQNILRTRLWERFGDEPDAEEKIRSIRNDLDALKHLPEGWREGVVQSFMEAFRGVWLTLLGMAVLALIFVSLMRQHTLHSTLDRR